MDYNELRKGIKVSGLSFGCSRLGKSIHEDTSNNGVKILQLAQDLGINFFDTATNYCYGDSEKIIGRFLKKSNKEIVISTKGGMKLSGMARYAPFVKPFFKFIKPFTRSTHLKKRNKKIKEFSSEYLTSRLQLSHQRMGVCPIPIYYLHNPSEETLKSSTIPKIFSEFKMKKWITLAGISVSSLMDVKECIYLDDVDIIQFPINYAEFQPEYVDILLMLKEKKIGLVGRTPFARGILAPVNQVNTGGDRGMKDEKFTYKKQEWCAHYRITEIQLALWFLKDLGLLDSILFSSFNPVHLKENVATYESSIPESFSWNDLIDL